MNISNSINSLQTHSTVFDKNATNIANSTNEKYNAKNNSIHSDKSKYSTKAISKQTNQQTDLAKDITNNKEISAGYTAQLKTIKMQDKITGELIDIIA